MDKNRAPPEWDRLLTACQKNQPHVVRRLIEQEGVDPSHANRVGQSALHVASLWGHVEAVEILLELGANVHATNQITGATPLHCAVQGTKRGTKVNRVATVQLLLDGGANPSMGDLFGSIAFEYTDEEDVELRELLKPVIPPIFIAIDDGDVGKVEELLKADKTIVNSRFRTKTPLLKVVGGLLSEEDEGDEAEAIDSEKQVQILKLLLDHGGDPNASLTADRGGHLMPQEEPEDPPLHQVCLALKEAFRSKNEKRIQLLEQIGQILKQGGAKLSPQTSQLLHDAARRSMTPMAAFLVDKLGVDPNTKGRQGMTPLQFAARSGKTDMVKLLLSHYNIDLSIKDDRGQTALDAAKVNGKTEIVSILENYDEK